MNRTLEGYSSFEVFGWGKPLDAHNVITISS